MLLAGYLTYCIILNLYYQLMMLYHHVVPTAPAALSLRIPLFSYFSIWSTAKRQNGYSPPRVLQCQKHNFFLHQLTLQFLDAFAKLRKVTISFVVSVCPSVHPHGTPRLPLGGFSWNLIFEHFSKICIHGSVEKVQVALKSDKKNENFTWRPVYICYVSRSIILRMRNVSDRSYS
jgi:hypothetical protein